MERIANIANCPIFFNTQTCYLPEYSYPKIPKICDPILVTLLKPHYCQSIRKNATPPSCTSPLAACRFVLFAACGFILFAACELILFAACEFILFAACGFILFAACRLILFAACGSILFAACGIILFAACVFLCLQCTAFFFCLQWF